MNLKQQLKSSVILPSGGPQMRRVQGRPGPNGGWEIEIEGFGNVEISPQATVQMAIAMLRSQGLEMAPAGLPNA